MRNLLMLAMFVFITTIAVAQEKEKRPIGNFSHITVSSGINLYLTQSSDEQLEVVCRKDMLHKLITEVEGNTLKIYIKGNGGWNWGSDAVPNVYVSFRQLESLEASGGSDVYGQNMVEQSSMKINTSGGADVYLEVKTDEISLTTSGGSDIKIKGTTNKLVAASSGGSDINARDLKAQIVKVNASGGSDAIVCAEKELIANASGGSDIEYYGNPQQKQLNESGAGDISQR